jgi:hypothetical protein
MSSSDPIVLGLIDPGRRRRRRVIRSMVKYLTTTSYSLFLNQVCPMHKAMSLLLNDS